jgi:uncharacterized alpha-E superfamily protein
MMLSRTAESLFWIGRYLERVQDLARVVDVTYHARLEQVGSRRRSAADWEPLLVISGERERFFRSHPNANAAAVSSFLTFDQDNPNSILSCLTLARENARGLRDRISSEMWESLNTFYLWLVERSLLHEVSSSNLHLLYSEIKDRCFLFQGVAQGTMVHDEGWNFLRVGKFLERATMTARVLEVQYPLLLAQDTHWGAANLTPWIWLLRSLSAYEAYCKAFHLGVRPELVAEFLVFDRGFPRSILYSVASAESSLKRISESPPGHHADSAERIIGWLHAGLAYADKRAIVDARLGALLEDVQARCSQVSDELVETYFAYDVPGAHGA